MFVLIDEIREDIEAGEIGGVIGIDVSGRIPGLLAASVIDKLQRARGHAAVGAFFLRGGIKDRSKAKAKLPEAITNMHLPKDKKVLVIDDTYMFGRSTRPILRTLKALGYKAELMVLNDSIKELNITHPTAHYAIRGFSQPEIYGQRDLAGMEKTANAPTPYAALAKKDTLAATKRIYKKVVETRQLIAEMAKRIAARYVREAPRV